ncbi:MAG: FKBP-type peptidyl-prolyl cis-trans isomerase, partial [Candidatus Methanogasteraceae archaeon]
MTIEQGDFIRINYTGRSDDGTVFDTTEEEVAKEHEIHDEN